LQTLCINPSCMIVTQISPPSFPPSFNLSQPSISNPYTTLVAQVGGRTSKRPSAHYKGCFWLRPYHTWKLPLPWPKVFSIVLIKKQACKSKEKAEKSVIIYHSFVILTKAFSILLIKKQVCKSQEKAVKSVIISHSFFIVTQGILHLTYQNISLQK
jgi:hypothetical protein